MIFNKYAGIGSRNTPDDILKKMEVIAQILGKRGYCLRSGRAKGADSAFENGCNKVGGMKEIYLPWKNFGEKWGMEKSKSDVEKPSEQAMVLAKSLVEEYKDFDMNAERWVWLLVSRNMHQILGNDLNDPVKFVICYTKNGEDAGGTRWALRLARNHNIPIYNLGFKGTLEKYLDKISV